ncbi:MAG: hypothetical protein ACUVSV_06420, partial [Armatimonadota bacterium]
PGVYMQTVKKVQLIFAASIEIQVERIEPGGFFTQSNLRQRTVEGVALCLSAQENPEHEK